MFKTHIEEDILEEQVASKPEEIDIVVVLGEELLELFNKGNYYGIRG